MGLDSSKTEDQRHEVEPCVWVFNGNKNHFPSGVFSSKERADEWISAHQLSGTLTRYPIDVSVYEWVQSHGYWHPKRQDQMTPQFIANFSSAYTDHYHYGDEDEV